jgi:hypothetical protein
MPEERECGVASTKTFDAGHCLGFDCIFWFRQTRDKLEASHPVECASKESHETTNYFWNVLENKGSVQGGLPALLKDKEHCFVLMQR